MDIICIGPKIKTVKYNAPSSAPNLRVSGTHTATKEGLFFLVLSREPGLWEGKD
jgi:hypothetical protein